MVFKDPRNTVKGKKAYRRLFKAIKFLGRLFFSTVYIKVPPRCSQCNDLPCMLIGSPLMPADILMGSPFNVKNISCSPLNNDPSSRVVAGFLP